MDKRRRFLYQFIIIFCLSLFVTLINLGTKKNFIGDDAGLKYYNGDLLAEQSLYMWNELTFPGVSNVTATFGLPHSLFVITLFKMGVSSILIERILYLLFFLVSGTGYLLFLKQSHKDAGDSKWVSIMFTITSIHYAFNNFTTILTSFPQHNYHLSYMLFPWIFYVYKKNFEEKTSFLNITLFALLLILYFGGNISNTLSGLMIVTAYAIIFREKIYVKLKYLLLLSLEALLFSSYILLPIISSTQSSLYINVDADANVDSLGFNSSNTSLLNITRFFGFHSPSSLEYITYFTKNPLVILLSFYLLFLLVLYLRKNAITKYEKFFIILFLISAYLAKGAHPPLEEPFVLLFKKVFALQIYRAVYYKFVPFIVFSLLTSVSYIYVRYKNGSAVLKTSLLTCHLLLVLATSWPLFTGRAALNFHLVTVPESYQKILQYFQNTGVREPILSLPQTTDPILSWGRNNTYTSYSIQLNLLIGQPVWNWTYFNREIHDYIMSHHSTDEIGSLLKLFRIRYVLLQKDIPEDYYLNKEIKGRPEGWTHFLRYKNSFENSKQFEMLLDTDYFTLYKLQKSVFYPSVSVVNELIENESVTITDMLSSIRNEDNVAFINTKLLDETKQNILSEYERSSECRDANINYRKYNPAKYSLQINSKCRYIPISFSQGFDPSWELGNDKATQKFTMHTATNEYANFWILDIESYCKYAQCYSDNAGGVTTEISMIFSPQKYFELGSIVSIVSITLLFSVGVVLKHAKRNS